ncbi:MAG: hypothetical protein ACLPTZ_26025, partial [Beijerinckiaceae bacterium]
FRVAPLRSQGGHSRGSGNRAKARLLIVPAASRRCDFTEWGLCDSPDRVGRSIDVFPPVFVFLIFHKNPCFSCIYIH